MAKGKARMSIGIAVSCDGLLKNDYKIVTLHTSGSTVNVTVWGSGRRDGTNYIPTRHLRQMFVNSGQGATEVTKENGDD